MSVERIAEAISLARGQGPTTRPAATPAREGRRLPEDIVYTRTRVVAANPSLLRERRVIAGWGPGPLSDAYKILCTQVLQRLRDRNANALAVTSPGDREGKTLTAINLSLSLAAEVDQTVLLVDADLRRPSIHRYFGMPPGPGLSDHLIDRVPVEDLLVNPGVERFVLLPGGRPLQNSTEMLGSRRMVALVQELKARYPARLVVFDLPPVLSAADSVAFAPFVDAALMVVEQNRTSRDALQQAAELLGSVELIGTVMNKATAAALEERGRTRHWLRRLLRRRDAEHPDV